MKIKWLPKAVLVIVLLPVLWYILRFLSTSAYYANYEPNVPTEGIWYCETLQFQLSFESTEKSYAIAGGEKIACIYESEHNANNISVISVQENEDVPKGTILLEGLCCDLTDDQFVVIITDTGEEYIFHRIGR